MTFQILQWNMNGYINNYNELLLLLKTYKPQIISIQETHIPSNIQNIPIPNNFTLYSYNSNLPYGGAALLIHKSIQHQMIPTSKDFDNVTLEIYSVRKFRITSAYIPPSSEFHPHSLENVFNQTQDAHIITGDFNSWHQNWGSHKNNRKGNILANFINQSNYILLNDKSPTHLSTHNTLTHLDLTFCSPDIAAHAEWKTSDDLNGSDHFPIVISLFPTINHSQTPFKPKFQVNLANWSLFERRCTHFESIRPISHNINSEASNLKKILLQSANESIPQTKPHNKLKTVPWWNSHLTNLKAEKNRLFNIFRRNMTQENLLNYKKVNSKLKREIKTTKQLSIQKLTEDINPNTPTKTIWTNIRRFCGYKLSHGIHCLTSHKNPNQVYTNPKDIANEMATFWSENASDLNFPIGFQTRKRTTLNTPADWIPSKESIIIEQDINYIELTSALTKLKGKTAGIDRISYPMIKNSSQSFKQRLLRFYNSVFQNYIPQTFKYNLVIPLPKPKTQKTLANSYRPISLNLCLAKVLDKIIANRLWWFVTKHKLLNSRQTGFMRGKSTADTLLFIDYLASTRLSSKSHLTLISLDFEKAYDRIGIHTIVEQLKAWKLGPKITNCVINFMTHRKFAVRVNNQFSDIRPMDNGTPQGSPISVIIFLIAYNKLSSIISRHKEFDFCAYADDFYIITKEKKGKNPVIDMRSIFRDILDWCKYSGTRLSQTKSKYIHICRKHNCKCTILSHEINLPPSNELRVLGVIFNKRYMWNSQINLMSTALITQLNVIKCLATPKFNCDTQTLLTLVKTLLIPKISYGIFLYGSASKAQLKKIKTILNSAIRTALGALRSTPIANILFEANIRSVENQRDLTTARLFKTLLVTKHNPLHNIAQNYKKRKCIPKQEPAIGKILNLSAKLNLPTKHPKNIIHNPPSWILNPKAINTTLSNLNKNNTNPIQYQTKFYEIKEKYHNYTFIYTDGSKIDNNTTYSITSQNEVIKMSHLPRYSSTYSAEIIAICEAINTIKSKTKNFAICSDSLSAINSIANIYNYDHYPTTIRNIMIAKYPKIKLIWVPGHANITGNEFADYTAKQAHQTPTIMTDNFNLTDIKKYIKTHFDNKQHLAWNSTNDWYQQVNHTKTHITDFIKKNKNKVTRLDVIKFGRLRLGHTKTTHGHFMTNTNPTTCTCNPDVRCTIPHILLYCPLYTARRRQIFSNSNPMTHLSSPTSDSISLITKFLKTTNLYHRI